MQVKTVAALWETMRPKHWLKNVFILAPLFFSPTSANIQNMKAVALGFAVFSLFASAIYILNDMLDMRRDRIHPKKMHRPLASGELPMVNAVVASLVLVSLSIVLSVSFNRSLLVILIAYGAINIIYSLYLKHIVIIDVFCIAAGYVFRVLAGSILINVQPSPWILICTLLLAVFIALGKRRHELVLLNNESKKHRPVLDNYTPYLVDQLISVITPVTIISYILYTLDQRTIERLHTPHLYVSTIFVVIGIFRYLFIIHMRDLAGTPVEMVLKDKPFLLVSVIWVIFVAFMIYLGR